MNLAAVVCGREVNVRLLLLSTFVDARFPNFILYSHVSARHSYHPHSFICPYVIYVALRRFRTESNECEHKWPHLAPKYMESRVYCMHVARRAMNGNYCQWHRRCSPPPVQTNHFSARLFVYFRRMRRTWRVTALSSILIRVRDAFTQFNCILEAKTFVDRQHHDFILIPADAKQFSQMNIRIRIVPFPFMKSRNRHVSPAQHRHTAAMR